MICLAFNKSSSRWLICVGHWQYVPISVKTQVWILLQDIWHDTFIWINPIPYISIYIGHFITPDPSKMEKKHAISILHLTYLTRIYTNKTMLLAPYETARLSAFPVETWLWNESEDEPNLTSIFFKGVETTNQVVHESLCWIKFPSWK